MKRTVVITGGTKGIGLATAQEFAKNKWNVVATCRKPETREIAEKKLKALGLEVQFAGLNVTDESEVETLIEHVVKKYGRLDCFVNNAGFRPLDTPLLNTTSFDLKSTLDTNVMGVYYGMKYAIKQMLKQEEGGAVVNVASVFGLKGFPNAPLYSAAKHAVVGLTKSAALEFADKNIRINAVAPGVITTKTLQKDIDENKVDKEFLLMCHPMKRFGDAEDVAKGIYFLGSPHISFMTGTVLPIDGGISAY